MHPNEVVEIMAQIECVSIAFAAGADEKILLVS